MAPEQEKSLLSLFEKHLMLQKWILGVLVFIALCIAPIGYFLISSLIRGWGLLD